MEGKVNLENIPAVFPGIIDNNEKKTLPIEKSTKILEFKIDPNKSKEIHRILTIKFNDLNQEFGLHVRGGVAEFLNAKADIRIETRSDIWTDIVLGKITMEEESTNGKVKTNEKAVVSLFIVFE